MNYNPRINTFRLCYRPSFMIRESHFTQFYERDTATSYEIAKILLSNNEIELPFDGLDEISTNSSRIKYSKGKSNKKLYIWLIKRLSLMLVAYRYFIFYILFFEAGLDLINGNFL